ncbi:MAG: agmatinase [Desulfatibacillum sp.]|nr:agmatinase [Desulfatibacillum sp.]
MIVPDFVPFGGTEIPLVDLESSRIVVLPLPYEANPSYGRGSQDGPFHILDASTQMEAVDEETGQEWTTLKIHTCRPPEISSNSEKAVADIQQAAQAILDNNKFLLALGGDHAITIGTARAAAARYPGMGILQIDAHMDLRDTWNGSRFNHACVMRRLTGDDKIPSVAVGIRSFSKEERDFARQTGHQVFLAQGIDPNDDTWIDQIISLLPREVYLTLDLDGLDPSVIPGTGTPEPGGLGYRQVLDLIRTLGSRRRVVAADINELAAIPCTHVSEYTAARLAQKICLHCFG